MKIKLGYKFEWLKVYFSPFKFFLPKLFFGWLFNLTKEESTINANTAMRLINAIFLCLIFLSLV